MITTIEDIYTSETIICNFFSVHLSFLITYCVWGVCAEGEVMQKEK